MQLKSDRRAQIADRRQTQRGDSAVILSRRSAAGAERGEGSRATSARPGRWTAHRPALAALFTLALASPLFAHEGHHLEAREVMTWWTWEPWVVGSLTVMGLLYVTGLVRLWHNAGRNHGIRVWQAFAFIAGWSALIVALVSPLDALGEILFSAHMAQHEMLMVIAAPLIVLGRPFIAALWAIPAAWRRGVAQSLQAPRATAVWRVTSAPVVATVLHAAALWLWHVPVLYQATLRSDFIHALQHISFFGTAALFWWTLINGRYGRLGYGMAVVYVFITSAHSGALGALLTFSPHVWYPIYETTTRAWGLNAIEDQQLAGLIMWVPAGLIFLVLGLALFAVWLSEAERRVTLAENNFVRKLEK